MQRRGYLYVLANPAMPGLLKIGHTSTSPEERVRQLSTTGVPALFEIQASFLVVDAPFVERRVHEHFEECRFASNREFFAVSLLEVLEALIPILATSSPSVGVDVNADGAAPAHDLTEDLVEILQQLASAGSEWGLNVGQLKQDYQEPDLVVEVRLSKLLARKLVLSRRLGGGSNVTAWRITPRGIKFLSDHNLIKEWMVRK